MMTNELWKEVAPYFRPFSTSDKWGHPERMDPTLVSELHALRVYVGKPIHIHCGWAARDTGWHPLGCAVDIHIEGLSVIDQFLVASRFDAFNGIGVYGKDVWTRTPGIHLDTRPKQKRFNADARWGCRFLTVPGGLYSERTYVPLDRDFFIHLESLES